MANDFAFLPPWLRDVGAIVGLITGLVGIVRLIFSARPFAYLWPYGHTWKLFVQNPTKRGIIVNRVFVFPSKVFHCTAESHEVYGIGALKFGGFHYVVIAPDQEEEFLIRPRLGYVDAPKSWLLVVVTWQPLGGVPLPRLPIILSKTASQLRNLRRATSTPEPIPEPKEW